MTIERVTSILRRPGTIVAAAGFAVALALEFTGNTNFASGVLFVTLGAAQIVHQDQNVRLHGRAFGRLQAFRLAFERLEEGIGRVEEGIGRVEEGLGRVEEGIGRVEEGIGRVEEGIAGLVVRGGTLESNLRSDIYAAQVETQTIFNGVHDVQRHQIEKIEHYAFLIKSLVDDFPSKIELLRERIEQLGGDIDKSSVLLRKASSDQTGEIFSRLNSAHWHRERLYSQTEAAISLDSILTGRPGLPPLRDWALSPDSAVALYRIAEAHAPSVVLEFGSGTSTLILALEAARRGSGMVIACEHSEYFAEQTRQLLDSFGVANFAVVLHCPLVPTPIFDGDMINWYDLSGANVPAKIDLLVIDGPPSHEDERARLPAEMIFNRLAEDAIVVLDDSNRSPERAITERWISRGDFAVVDSPKTEKGMAVLRHTPNR